MSYQYEDINAYKAKGYLYETSWIKVFVLRSCLKLLLFVVLLGRAVPIFAVLDKKMFVPFLMNERVTVTLWHHLYV